MVNWTQSFYAISAEIAFEEMKPVESGLENCCSARVFHFF
jgi:hypothetical protein